MDLVAADADQIDMRIRQRTKILRETLSGIYMHQDARTLQAVCYRFDRLSQSGFVVYMHEADQESIWPDGSVKLVRVDLPIGQRPY
jgi:hypothetical protein